ncbi:MAG: tRNA lysidine(34) synthetase TilS [Spirochaetales bacterium]|nr:tRNA lysidine(34) synthetase TilS [Spirochaetales bacterium]
MSITVKTLELKVINYFKKYNISDKSIILIAYSGGPDSGALLWLLNSIQKEIGFSIHALYINHGIRSEQEMSDEILKIKRISEEINIKIDYENIENGLIKSESKQSGRSVEDLAREYRYSLLEKIKQKINATHIATGHTLDDQIETLIMRFFQGSGINGLGGIPEKRDYFIRPLMGIEKKELNEYIKINNISFVTDKTNFDPVYLRNKVRLNLIPVISEIFPGYKKSIGIFSEKMDMIRTILSENEKDLEVNMTKDGDSWFFRDDFIELPAYLQVEILYKSWDMWENKPFQRLPYRFLSSAVGYHSDNTSSILLDGYSCRLIKHKEMIIWKRVVVVSSKKSYLRVITVGEYKLFPGMYLNVEENTQLLEDTIWIKREKLKYPIIVRSKMPGDRIILAEGIKPLKKLFNDWGVVPEERWKIPVLEDRTGVIAVLGKPLGYSNRIALNYKNCLNNDTKLLISAYYMESISE